METNRAFEVEFYPSVDDYVVIATTVAKTVPVASWHHTFYSYFLFANLLVAPVVLWIFDYFVLGSILFLINLGMVYLFTPLVQSSAFRNHYEHLAGSKEKTIAKVRIDEEGLRHMHEGVEAFWPWEKFNKIEETEDAIYVYFDGNGLAVRKNGFPYREREREFYQFAESKVKQSKPKLIEYT